MEHVPCAVCGEERQLELWVWEDVRYVRCPSCSLVYEDPRMTSGELVEFYSSESYFIQDPAAGKGAGYENYLTQCSPALQQEYFAVVMAAATVKRGRYLDVGCGAGGVVETARSQGWDAVGQEISSWGIARARSRDIPVVEGDLLQARLPGEHFDAVSMFDVLEHLPSPLDYLREIHRILRPGGVLVVETPNIDGVFARYLYRARSDLVKPRAHICLYNTRSIQRLVEHVPFARLTLKTFPYSRKFTWEYAKALLATRLLPGRTLVQLTWNESLRLVCWK